MQAPRILGRGAWMPDPRPVDAQAGNPLVEPTWRDLARGAAVPRRGGEGRRQRADSALPTRREVMSTIWIMRS
jgi:hypothetical protein